MIGEIANVENGFFFIRGEDGRQYFGHRSDLDRVEWIHRVQKGDTVSFDVVSPEPERGPRAESITVNRLLMED